MSNPLLEQFIAEAADLLDQVDDSLLRLEQDPSDLNLVNEIFRAAHTLKGSSGLFDLPELTRLTHAAEDLLDSVRSGKVDLDGIVVDGLLSCFDQIRAWMSEVEVSGQLPPDAAVTGRATAESLRSMLGTNGAPTPGTVAVAVGGARQGATADAPPWLLAVPEPILQELATWLTTTSATIRAVRYLPDPGCFFRGEDPLQLVRQVHAIEYLAILPGEPLPEIAKFEEFDCLLQFVLLTRSAPEELAHIFRYVLDQVELVEVSGPVLVRMLAAEQRPTELAPQVGANHEPEVAHALLLAQETLLAATETGEDWEAWEARVRSAAGAAIAAAGLAGLDHACAEDRLQAALAAHDVGPVQEWIRQLLASPPLTLWAGGSSGGRVDAEPGTAGPATCAMASPDDGSKVSRSPDGVAVREEAGAHSQRLLKVEQVKVDRLLDLAGELVVAKNALPFVAAEADDLGQTALARRIRDEYAVISRVGEEFQQAVMDVRMLTVSVAFARIPRLVRDLTRQLGKNARLVQEGEDAAADKDVIESLAEPLVHLVRNSLDHGIESPQEREAAGKSPEATLTLRAASDGDAVIVEIADDGRGIDATAIRRVAHERGLIDDEALGAMSDEGAIHLLFEPGFSTAREVSDVSGRGVGLDAVRTGIEKLGGSVAIASQPGEGTTVRLRLPLTMAVSRVLLLVVGDERFGIQVDDVVETVSVPVDHVQLVARREVLVLRDDMVPLARLASLLDLPVDGSERDLNVLIVRTPTGPLGLIVDGFRQATDVILKPLEGLLTNTPGYCGTALLGDGRVLLVLDVKELNNRAIAVR